MYSAISTTSNEAFEPNLKSTPRLVYQRFRHNLIDYASGICNEITGSTGIVAFIFSAAQWADIPGNSIPNAAGVMVIQPIYDLTTPIVAPVGAAANAAVKMYEIARFERNEVQKAIAALKRRLINSLPPSAISELSHPLYGMMTVSPQQIFAHLETNYSVLNQEDFDVIFTRLQAPKLATHDYQALAEIHRDLHSLLAGAGQPSTEFSKTSYFIQALRDDHQGREAVTIFIRAHPLVATRTFIDLVATVILHAPTIIPTTATLGYSNALSAAPTASAHAVVMDESALAQLISKSQKDLAALKKKNGTISVPPASFHPPRGSLKYCYKHGYQHSHPGAVCKVLLGSPLLYSAQHLAAKDHLTPAGGNPAIQG